MKKILLLLMVGIGILNSNAQNATVTLKVIDNEDGALTNNVDDNNETNVFCWAGSDAGAFYEGDWWYPMYAGETGRTGGELIKESGVWTWQCTFYNVAEGEYRWNPHMKTLGWASINNLYTYGESADIYFSVAADGTITGQTTLELPLTSTSNKVVSNDSLKAYSVGKRILIENLNEAEQLIVFDLSGKLVSQMTVKFNVAEVCVDQPGIYLVKTTDSSLKVLVK
ncbi:hypothetical protein E9993_11985 [Labilibacter sediminis]|nr:hypothetical protein E9993_11985 [Labilibacter sediminis]